MVARSLAGLAIAGALTQGLLAQTATPAGPPKFEVASIRKVASVDDVISQRVDGETYTVRNMTVRQLVGTAYNNRFFLTEIVGGPDWADTDRFQIVAKTGRPNAPWAAMLLNLLRDRFKVNVREDREERPIYRMVMARADGQWGPKLRRSGFASMAECLEAAKLGPGKGCGARSQPGNFEFHGQSMSSLIFFLSSSADRRLVDDTGLTGLFDFELQWDAARLTTGVSAGGAGAAGVNSDAGSLFSAIQEQLGIKLVSARAIVPVLVLESVEHPTED